MTVEGPSGLGKTRLLRALSQLDPPLTGEMKFLDSEEAGLFGLLGQAPIPNWRRRSIYVPQVSCHVMSCHVMSRVAVAVRFAYA